MATHSLNTRSTIYRYFSNTSEILTVLQENEQVTVLEENVGFDCSFNKISFNNLEGYINKDSLDRLPQTPESAPFVCSVLSVPQGTYVEPDWQMLADKAVYFNETTNEYSVTVLIDNGFLNDRGSTDRFAKEKGLKALLEYYNKVRDPQTIQRLLSYFIFVEVKDLYIPFRPRTRPKALVVVKKRYFDAVEENQQQPEEIDISKANFIVRLDSKQIRTIFDSVIKNLKSYDDDIYLSNTKLQIKLGTDETGLFNTSDKLRETLSLKEKAEKVKRFYDKLNNLVSLNGFNIETTTSRTTQFIELAINDKCNVLYDVAININNNCTKLRTGLLPFLQTDPIDDPTIIAFVKNADRISKIEKCVVPWTEFVETYVYPEVMLQNISTNDIIQNFEKNKYEYAKDLQQILSSLAYESSLNPAKTAKQIFEEERQLADLKSVDIWSKYKDNFDKNPFTREIFKGDNFFNPTNINNTLNNLEAALASNEATANRKTVAYNDATKTYRVVEEIPTSSTIRLVAQYQFSDTDTYEYPQSGKSKLVPLNPSSPYGFLSVGTSIINVPIYITPIGEVIPEVDRNEFFLFKLYQLVNKVGLCKIIDFTSNCLISLVRDFADIDFNATLAVGQISSLNSKELKDDAIPYLPKEQQELVYNELLMKLPCLTSASLLYILKRSLPPEQYNALNLEQASYENIASEIATLMSTSPK